MLTVLRRAQQATRQADRVLARKRARKEKNDHKQTWKAQSVFIKETLKMRKEARKETKEDTLMGPIAPRRAITVEEQEKYYALDGDKAKVEPMRRKVGVEEWALAIGDRVVLLKGPDRHKIGTINAIDKDSNSVTVEGLNQYPFRIPEFFKKISKAEDAQSVMYREAPIHYDDVRLVFPLLDPETNEMKDTIIAKVDLKGFYKDRNRDKVYRTRYIAGSNFQLPWPKGLPYDPKDEAYDTRIMDVEEITYLPTLLQPPLPDGVIDELRNKYSKYRTRHDPEYIAKKEVELAFREEKLKAKGFRIDERGNLVKERPPSKFVPQTPVLDDSVLAEIGKFMAKKNPGVLEEVMKMQQAPRARTQASS